LPDWSDQTVIRPVLTRVPFEVAWWKVFGVFRQLANVPGGGTVIDLLAILPTAGVHSRGLLFCADGDGQRGIDRLPVCSRSSSRM